MIAIAALAATITLFIFAGDRILPRPFKTNMGNCKSAQRTSPRPIHSSRAPVLSLYDEVYERMQQVPVSTGSKGEIMCRAVMTAYVSFALNKSVHDRACQFPSVRPNYIRNPITKRRLEIDCFNERLRLGVEYDGKQHYERVPHFQRTPSAHQRQLQRDSDKYSQFRKHNLTIISVPYFVQIDNIPRYLLKQLDQLGITPEEVHRRYTAQ